MMKKLAFIFLTLLFVGCGDKNIVYNDFQKLPEDYQWKKNEDKIFDVEITKESNYDITFTLSHVYGFQFSDLPLICTIQDETGNKKSIPFKMIIKDSTGKDLGDCAGDICDVNQFVKSKLQLKKGKYKVVFSHSFNFPYIPNIIGVGCTITDTEKS